MKLVERKNNEIIEIRTIDTIDGLNNSDLILLERGDTMKRAVKGGRTMFGNKSLYSVKSMKDAIAVNEAKQNKKPKKSGHHCCVCGDWYEDNARNFNEAGICHYCQI